MSLGVAQLILEITAAHILPTLAVEVGRYAFTRAAQRAEANRPPGQPATNEKRAVKPRPHHLKLVKPVSVPQPTRLISDTPGRVRLEIDGARGAPWRAADIATRLRAITGVSAASVSPLTGTALIAYDPHITTVAHILGDSAGAEPGERRARGSEWPSPASRRTALLRVGAAHGRRLPPAVPRETGQLPLEGLWA